MSAWTEDQAGEHWCPFARVAVIDLQDIGSGAVSACAVNRGELAVDRATRCVGGLCMAWRWLDQATKQTPLMSHAEAVELGGANATPPTRLELTENRRGFCGLAGALHA